MHKAIRKIAMIMALGASALALAQTARAQQTYPTAAAGVRVPGTVPLQCNASGAACAPVSAANAQAVAAQPYPASATAVAASQTGAASALGATLGTAVGQTTYICGFTVTGAGATAASVVTVTVTNVVASPMSYKLAVPAGATVGVAPLIQTFSPCLQASATNTAIVVSVPSLGVGNTDAAVMAWGYRQ